MDAFKSLSDSTSALAAAAGAKLFHVPSPLGGRTALGFDGKLLLVPASEASEGESLEILGPGGKKVDAKVKGFDPGLGLAVLELGQALPESSWKTAPGLPALGSLVLVAAYPSPEGPEVRLDSLRFAGGEGTTPISRPTVRPSPDLPARPSSIPRESSRASSWPTAAAIADGPCLPRAPGPSSRR